MHRVHHGRCTAPRQGPKVRRTATARVEGDIVNKPIAIESGAQFEGTVQRQEDPLGDSGSRPAAAAPARPKTDTRDTRDAPPLTGGAVSGKATSG